MTLHIEIDKETENALAAMAKLDDLSIEDAASQYLKAMVRAKEAHLAKLRYEVKKGFDSPVVEDFDINDFLQKMREKHAD